MKGKETMPRPPAYLKCFAVQLGALGPTGQRRLRRASVLIGGAGGLGSAIASILALAGVGKLVLVDPQRFEVENFNRYLFATGTETGQPKAEMLANFFESRPHLEVVPVVDRVESLAPELNTHDVGLIISATNTVNSRLALARLAFTKRIAHVAAAIADGREERGGSVVAWLPERPELACPACLLTRGIHIRRGESLLAPVISSMASIAAYVAVEILSRRPRRTALELGNCLTLNLGKSTLESLRVMRRPNCQACTNSHGKVARQAER